MTDGFTAPEIAEANSGTPLLGRVLVVPSFMLGRQSRASIGGGGQHSPHSLLSHGRSPSDCLRWPFVSSVLVKVYAVVGRSTFSCSRALSVFFFSRHIW